MIPRCLNFKKIRLPFKVTKPVLALGAQAKNTICFARGAYAYLTGIHGDLSNPKDFSDFVKDLNYFLKGRPKIIAHDLHPEYVSTKYAQNLASNLSPITYHLSPVQHHHAHIASCMAENGLKNQKVIGVAFDGTGLGTNGSIWGAEFLLCNYRNFKRAGHLKEIPLLGLEKAIAEPVRIALAWLYASYKDRFWKLDIDLLKKINKRKWPVLRKMYVTGLNSPLASSMGRLFDAIASLVLARHRANVEAELAIELEREATGYRLQATGYSFGLVKNKMGYIIEPLPMFKEIIEDLKAKVAKEKIAYQFHLTVAQMIRGMCLILRKETGMNKIILSGGVFQNNLLLNLSLDLLYKEGFNVVRHKKLPCNDAAVSLGQAVIAGYSG